MSDLECKICADPPVTSPHGVPATPGQAVQEFTAWAAAQGIMRGEMYGWATMSDVFAAGRRAAVAAQEPHAAPELGGTVTIDGQTFPQAAPALELADAVAKSDRLEGQNEDLRGALAALRDGVTALAARLDASAAATRPSRKSDIESEIAIALRQLLE